nr:UDP-N-acetylmuramoyl-tripeptide--D-alanyl-D-alanine ligase [Roseivirga thermotolerans]
MAMIDQLYSVYLRSTGVSTDTRTLQKDNLWFALKGPNFNANKFADKALELGACAVVIDDPAYARDNRYLVVEDGLKALQQLANHHRKQFNIPVIGITGSNGKTTTKELVRDVLDRKFRVLATLGNFNNHIGVPLTLLRLTADTEMAIVEMGANFVGDIAQLCAIAEPTFGLITNIGKAHLEGFGGIEGVFKGKTELYEHVAKQGGVLFVNSRNQRLMEKAGRLVGEIATYPDKDDVYHAELIDAQPFVKLKARSGKVVDTQISGSYNFENICAALCIGAYFGVPENEALEAIAAYIPENNRSQIKQLGSNTVVMDAYNANPTSMALALQNFAAKPGYKVAILGDMFELGESAAEEHAAVGNLTAGLALNQVIFCGELMKHAYETNKKAEYFEDKQELATYLKGLQLQDSQILIKGSRGMSLETLLESF